MCEWTWLYYARSVYVFTFGGTAKGHDQLQGKMIRKLYCSSVAGKCKNKNGV